MSELGNAQEKFSRMCVKFELWLLENGYEIRQGDSFRDPRVHGKMGEKKGYGRRNSLHKLKLARDYNLFKDGDWLSETEQHREAGEKWESMGGAWGGRFQDGNHYSLAWKGFR